MSVTITNLDKVEAECRRFLERVEKARQVLKAEMKADNERWAKRDAEAAHRHYPSTEATFTHPGAATGAVRRASMDLSRILADFRQSAL